MRSNVPVHAPETAHVWPVMSDSVNTSGADVKEGNNTCIVHLIVQHFILSKWLRALDVFCLLEFGDALLTSQF